MHKELEAFFDLHRDETAKHTEAAHQQIGTALGLAHDAQLHVMRLQAAMRRATVASQTVRVDTNMNQLRTRLKATEVAVAAYLAAAETVAACFVELDDAFSLQQLQMTAVLEGNPEGTPSLAELSARL
jgi:hypothetical protein